MKKILFCAGLLLSFNSFAAEYSCKVYCNSGSTYVSIYANSSSEAAEKIDPTPVANQICQNAGKGNASSSSMSSNQCTRQ